MHDTRNGCRYLATLPMVFESLDSPLSNVREGGRLTLQDHVARLFEEMREDVYRYQLTLGLHPPQAQEATQEVFLRLYACLKRGEQIQSPRAWVYRVAHNLGLKIRAKQASLVPFEPTLAGELRDAGSGPEQALLEKERRQRFHDAIGSLSEQQRRCLFLRLEGLRYPEIADTLGISPSAVGEFLRRAISRIHKLTAPGGGL